MQHLSNLATSILIKERKLKNVQQKIAKLKTSKSQSLDGPVSQQASDPWPNRIVVHPEPSMTGEASQHRHVSDGSSTISGRSLSIGNSFSEDAGRDLPMEQSTPLLLHHDKRNRQGSPGIRYTSNVSFTILRVCFILEFLTCENLLLEF